MTLALVACPQLQCPRSLWVWDFSPGVWYLLLTPVVKVPHSMEESHGGTEALAFKSWHWLLSFRVSWGAIQLPETCFLYLGSRARSSNSQGCMETQGNNAHVRGWHGIWIEWVLNGATQRNKTLGGSGAHTGSGSTSKETDSSSQTSLTYH